MDLSIIIPYYNSGKYINEALESVYSYKGRYTYEIILINDGSIDALSLDVLSEIEAEGKVMVLHQENKGPGAARNYGVSQAKGEFLLFLDSDNKIKPEYIDKALDVLKRDDKIGVVYANAETFGDGTRQGFQSRPFDIVALLAQNYIDMCSVVRKKAFDEAGGFDEDKLLYVYEDWDLWLSVYERGWSFYFMKETLFFYRVRNASLIGNDSVEYLLIKRIAYIYRKHTLLLAKYYSAIYFESEFYKRDKERPFRSFVKYLFLKIKK